MLIALISFFTFIPHASADVYLNDISNYSELSAARNQPGYSVIEYGSESCGPCRAFVRDLGYISKYLGNTQYYSADVSYFNVGEQLNGYPEFQVYHKGQRLKVWVGYGSADTFIDRVLSVEE